MSSLPRSARPQREAAVPVPPLPHPSWDAELRRAGDRTIAISAREFWNRLGL